MDRPLTPARQRRQRVEELLRAQPQRSNLAIAKEVGVDEGTVRNWRCKLESNSEIPQTSERVEASGRQARGRKPGAGSRYQASPATPPKANPIPESQRTASPGGARRARNTSLPPQHRHHLEEAFAYAAQIVAGTIPAGRWVKAACARFLADYRRAQDPASPWMFDSRRAVAPIVFAGMMPHVKGPKTGELIELLSFQKWLLANLFGFVDRSTGQRRFRQASVWIPKSNGKSSLAAVLGLFCTFTEGEGGAEGYSAAVSREQAKIVFEIARQMVLKTPDFARAYGIEVTAHAVAQISSMSSFKALSSAAKALDGLNVHFAVLDEIGSHRTSAVHDTLITAMGKRTEPLMISISTATDNTTGVGKVLWNYTEQVLDGRVSDDRFFGVIYAADDGDDPWQEKTWIKTNPGFGPLVQPEALHALAVQAQASPALKAAFLTRHLNIWVGADHALFDLGYWDRCANPKLDLAEFRGQPCFAAIDMAVRVDLAAASVVFPYSEDGSDQVRYAVFHQAWLPEKAVDSQRNPLYVQWAESGALTVTDGETTSFEAIEDWLRGIAKQFDLRACAYDPYVLMQLAQRLENEGYPMFEYRSTTLNFSEPTKLLDAVMRDRLLEHDASPVARFCIGNCVGHYDRRNNVYPTKPRQEAKIDCAIATIMALGASFAAEIESQRIYADGRDLLVF